MNFFKNILKNVLSRISSAVYTLNAYVIYLQTTLVMPNSLKTLCRTEFKISFYLLFVHCEIHSDNNTKHALSFRRLD